MNWPFKSKYVRKLEDDNARLLGENRALLNSILGTAGVGPVDFPKEPLKPVNLPRRMSMFQLQRKTERESEQRILERSKNVRREEQKSAS
jgi:hypothetical protein